MTRKVELGEGMGSGWKFRRINEVTFTAVFGRNKQGLSRAIVGGKRQRIESETDDGDSDDARVVVHNVQKYRKKKKKESFILEECEASDIGESEGDSENEADKALIDDRMVVEDYVPMNYAADSDEEHRSQYQVEETERNPPTKKHQLAIVNSNDKNREQEEMLDDSSGDEADDETMENSNENRLEDILLNLKNEEDYQSTYRCQPIQDCNQPQDDQNSQRQNGKRYR